jgi:poly-beta-1,6-N-acetyl-D-glucosamine synthase
MVGDVAWLWFALFAGLVGYVLVGYPALLALAARGSRPHQKRDCEPTVSVIIPAYNGESFLAAKLRSVLSLDYPKNKLEILVVSDGSTDRTDELAAEFELEGVRLLRVERGGKPAALNTAIPTVNGEILLLTDVRQILAKDSLRLLVRSFADPAVGVVSGELVISNTKGGAEAEIGAYWRFELWIRDRLSQIDSMFGATGAIYAMRRSLAVTIPTDMLLDDMYLPLSAYFKGYRLVMEREAKAYDIPTSREAEFRRKVRTLAGNFQILMAYPALLGPGNRMWWHFVSYKLGRLLLPWALACLLICSVLLPNPWRWPVCGVQLCGYGLAAVDGWIPAGMPLKRLSSPARTFVVMMIAAALALKVFFVPPQSLWKVTAASAGKEA